jgi:putative zinc finger protein
MRHGAARRLLPQRFDRTLSPALEQALGEHVARCERCRRHRAELELCERLVTRLPLAVVPLVVAAAGDQRLERLARWAFLRPSPQRGRALEGFAMAAAAATLAGVVALAGATRWLPAPAPASSSLTQVAYVMP